MPNATYRAATPSIVQVIGNSMAILHHIAEVSSQKDWTTEDIVAVIKEYLGVDASELIKDPKCAIREYFNQRLNFELRCYETEGDYAGHNGSWIDGGLTLKDTIGIIEENKLFDKYEVIIFRPHCDEFEETVKRDGWPAYKNKHLPKERHVAVKFMIAEAMTAMKLKTEGLKSMKAKLDPSVADDKYEQRVTSYDNSIARCNDELAELQFSLDILQ